MSIFSSRHEWSAPQTVVLSREGTQGFGFSVRGNSPVIIAEVDRGSLAEVSLTSTVTTLLNKSELCAIS